MGHSMKIPEYLLEGVDIALRKKADRAKSKHSSFDELYAQGQLPLALAQQNLNLTEHGLGTYEDGNGVVWVLEDNYIYRVAEED